MLGPASRADDDVIVHRDLHVPPGLGRVAQVRRMSWLDGVRSPLGWLWTMISAVARAREGKQAITSRTWTEDSSTEPCHNASRWRAACSWR